MTEHTNTDPKIVLGYESRRYEDNTAALYCVTVDGDVFTTGQRLYTREVRDSFKVYSDWWTKCDALPTDAYFIGRYPTPSEVGGYRNEIQETTK